MFIAIIITLVVLGVLAIVVTLCAVLSAKDGMEDADGFHALESAPRPKSSPKTRDHPPHVNVTTFKGRLIQTVPADAKPDLDDGPAAALTDHTAGAGAVCTVAGDWPNINQRAGGGGETAVLTTDYFPTSSRFWFGSFSNRPSEFLALGSLVALSIFICDKNPPESKDAPAPQWKVGASSSRE